MNWFYHFHSKQWVHIEQLIAPYDLQVLSWLDIPVHGPLSSLPFFTAHLVCVWDKLQPQLGLSPNAGLMAPLFGNQQFPAKYLNPFIEYLSCLCQT